MTRMQTFKDMKDQEKDWEEALYRLPEQRKIDKINQFMMQMTQIQLFILPI
jgi:hypothetical protein